MRTIRAEPIRLAVYARAYCHLCDDMIAELKALAAELEFELETIDIDAHPELEIRYGELVPVLVHGEQRICHYYLDHSALTAYLGAFR